MIYAGTQRENISLFFSLLVNVGRSGYGRHYMICMIILNVILEFRMLLGSLVLYFFTF